MNLVGDIGGTHARFACWSPMQNTFSQLHVQRCIDQPSLSAALHAYLSRLDFIPQRAALAVAAPVRGDAIALVNHPWQFSVTALRAAFGWSSLTVVNDFTALALAIPQLAVDDHVSLGGPDQGDPRGAIAVLGPGTGLGVSGLIPHPQGFAVIQGEGGHRSLAPTTPAEWALAAAFAAQGPVSLETLLCGEGLVRLYRHFVGDAGLSIHPPAIFARRFDDPMAQRAIESFCSLLGSAAGDLALTLGATGGVYLGGGLLPRLTLAELQHSPLRAQFENKGRYRAYLQTIPLTLITAEHPTLRGVATLFAQPVCGMTATAA